MVIADSDIDAVDKLTNDIPLITNIMTVNGALVGGFNFEQHLPSYENGDEVDYHDWPEGESAFWLSNYYKLHPEEFLPDLNETWNKQYPDPTGLP